MTEIEFFSTPDGVFTDTIHMQVEGEVITFENAPEKLIVSMFRKIDERYPDAVAAIRKMGHTTNRQIVRQFVSCNFGIPNSIPDIDDNGKFNFERVKCDKRKACAAHGVICQLY